VALETEGYALTVSSDADAEPSPHPAATEQVDERELVIERRSPSARRFARVAEVADSVAEAN